MFSTALWDLAKCRPVHSLMFSSDPFLCLPCLLPPFIVPWKMVLVRLDERETCPYHFSRGRFTMVRRSWCGPIAYWILAQISSLITWSVCGMHSILRWLFISMACIPLCSSAMRVLYSQAHRKMDVTIEHISHLKRREMLLPFQIGFNFVNAAVICAILRVSQACNLLQTQLSLGTLSL